MLTNRVDQPDNVSEDFEQDFEHFAQESKINTQKMYSIHITWMHMPKEE